LIPWTLALVVRVNPELHVASRRTQLLAEARVWLQGPFVVAGQQDSSPWCQKYWKYLFLRRATLMGDPSDVPDRSDLVAALTPDARPAAVLRWLLQGHQRFLAGQSLHPHSTRERMQSVVEGQHPLAA